MTLNHWIHNKVFKYVGNFCSKDLKKLLLSLPFHAGSWMVGRWALPLPQAFQVGLLKDREVPEQSANITNCNYWNESNFDNSGRINACMHNVCAYLARPLLLFRCGKNAGSQISPVVWHACLHEVPASAFTTWSALSGGHLPPLEQKS